MPLLVPALIAFVIVAFVAPANAAVTITFYSHKLRLVDGFSTDFPHAFVLLSGTTESGEQVNRNLGFSATSAYVRALWEPIDGALDAEPLPSGYVEGATRHFSFPISDAEYRAVIAVAEKWRTAPQPSYEIDTRNCVIFIKEIAVTAGLSVSDDVKFIHHPREFLEDVALRNSAFLAQAGDRAEPSGLSQSANPNTPH